MNKAIAICLLFFIFNLCTISGSAQAFIHPGIDQNSNDLALMKKKVQAGEEPYKSAFNRLKTATDTVFKVNPHTHVLRGPYGKPNIGGDDLSRSASMAYNYALMWYLTSDKKYAQKAIEILNAWSPVLWDFDYNDAKLLAAWTGHQLCNAAEILRYTDAGWEQKDVDSFTNMLLTAYYPLFRFYYPQANGNWDGAIIHSILAISIFTDNRKMFNNAIEHYLYGPVNGSVFKYVYPSGQCQESTRDQGHVQLGLGEFAGAAQIAYTQGKDLLSAGDNRLALGYEYTARFLMGEKPHSYGPISERAKALRDDYEYVYRHYTARGIDMPYTKMAADSARSRSSRSILTAVRSDYGNKTTNQLQLKPVGIGYIAGAQVYKPGTVKQDAIIVHPGESVQAALNQSAGTGKWVLLKTGIHKLPATLKLPSGITLAGEGIETIVFLDPSAEGMRDAMVNDHYDMHDVTIRDLKIEGSNRTEVHSDPNSTRSYRGNYNRGGIILRALKEGHMKNINLVNVSLLNCTYNGLFISGASNVNIQACDLSENGGNAVPGPKLQHNILLTHCDKVTVTNSRLGTSPFGSGISLAHSKEVNISNNEIARNAYYGVQIAESSDIAVSGNLIEGNDRSGIMVEFLSKGSSGITVSNNRIQFNGAYGLEAYSSKELKNNANTYTQNKDGEAQVKSGRVIVME
ncbi:right-handed parallel beta-helix repeat-containing protein [Flavitalea sp.]|nr:right-handed parallel beta-helix repeat-containing protein [Flavitalea sp.]